jgi:hypothetical protein
MPNHTENVPVETQPAIHAFPVSTVNPATVVDKSASN